MIRCTLQVLENRLPSARENPTRNVNLRACLWDEHKKCNSEEWTNYQGKEGRGKKKRTADGRKNDGKLGSFAVQAVKAPYRAKYILLNLGVLSFLHEDRGVRQPAAQQYQVVDIWGWQLDQPVDGKERRL